MNSRCAPFQVNSKRLFTWKGVFLRIRFIHPSVLFAERQIDIDEEIKNFQRHTPTDFNRSLCRIPNIFKTYPGQHSTGSDL